MAPKNRTEAKGDAGEVAAVSEALERLFAAPLDGFVALRSEIARALRAAGDAPASRLVAAATKPSRTAWALNQVARRKHELLSAVFEARAKAAEAQKTGEGEVLRATARAYRDRLADVVQAAGDAVREDGSELTAVQGRRISATIQAIVGAEEAEGRETLRAGRLVADVDVDDPFAGLEVGPARPPKNEAPPPPTAQPARDELAPKRAAAEAARARARELERVRAHEREKEKRARELESLRARLANLEEEARDTRASARQAEIAAARAQAEAERARRAVETVEKRLDDARSALRLRSS